MSRNGIKIDIDTSGLYEITRVQCIATKCKFNMVWDAGLALCSFRSLFIDKDGKCEKMVLRKDKDAE